MGLNSANCSDVLILFHDVELVQLGYSKDIVKFLKYRTRLFTNQIDLYAEMECLLDFQYEILNSINILSYCLLTSLPDYILCFQHLTLLPHEDIRTRNKRRSFTIKISILFLKITLNCLL